jgi:surface carbohydrate biosynthesis protein
LLLIRVENQVRELDPKLLLACVAAERGFSSVIGSRWEMEFNIDAFPRSIYLSKSMTVRSLLFSRVANKFDHQIVTWDEEALVHLPSDTYFSRRLDPRSIRYVSHLFAWGQDMNLFKPVKDPDQKAGFVRVARGMCRSYAEGLQDHKQAFRSRICGQS